MVFENDGRQGKLDQVSFNDFRLSYATVERIWFRGSDVEVATMARRAGRRGRSGAASFRRGAEGGGLKPTLRSAETKVLHFA
jgi:hypothetical protein